MDVLRANGIEVDKRKIQPSEPIKSLGDFQVPIKLHTEVIAQIKVSVVPDQEPVKKAEAPADSETKETAEQEESTEPEETEKETE